MSEVTFNQEQLRQAALILWQKGQFHGGRLACDEDDVHEYLVEEGLLKQDGEADTDADPDAYQWLSGETLAALHGVRVEPSFTFGSST